MFEYFFFLLLRRSIKIIEEKNFYKINTQKNWELSHGLIFNKCSHICICMQNTMYQYDYNYTLNTITERKKEN